MMRTRMVAALLAAGLLSPGMREVNQCLRREDTDEMKKTEKEIVRYVGEMIDETEKSTTEEVSGEFVRFAAKFGFDLLTETADKTNVMVSPLSILCALGMTANGAEGNTKSQMETVLFGGESTDVANRYFRGFMDALACEGMDTLSVANSIWLNRLRGDCAVNADFLSRNVTYYGADVLGVPFDDAVAGKMNTWVSDKTDGMIPEIIDRLSGDEWMVLINAVLFDGKWAVDYADHAVITDAFTSHCGTVTEREMLCSTEQFYFRLGNGAGFVRPYAEKYSFVGILPDEGEDVFAYAASIDGAAFVDAVTGAEFQEVLVRIPSFTFDYAANLTGALSNMGMPDAFDNAAADFSRMGTCEGGNPHLSEVLHKTRIELTRTGTKAAAATSVMVRVTCAMPTEEPKQIYLDRPFVFAIVENETGLPIFCGIVSELK